MASKNSLNDQQKKAVESVGRPILVFAGAGSGKTRVLTHKIAYLISEIGLPPDNILAMTFTNKAASEMKERVQDLVLDDVSSINIGTFHSICARILRVDCPAIGFERNFTIYDQQDSRTLVRNVIDELKLDRKSFDPKSVQTHISSAKNQMIGPEDYYGYGGGFRDEKIAEIYAAYQDSLVSSNAMDFDDLLLHPLKLFNLNDSILSKYRNKFKYILVDEYQDTNKPQFTFIHQLAKEHQDICVVGDDDQSIYGWRGADINNILDFSNAFPDCMTIKLEQNYRSTGNILDAAWNIVSKNDNRAEKKLWTDRERGNLIEIGNCVTDKDESQKILEIIMAEQSDGIGLDQISILYRTNAQSRIIEDILRRNSVPYQIIGSIKFYDRKEIKDLIAFLRIISNDRDEISFNRVVNFPPRGIGAKSIEKINKFASSNKISSFDALSDIDRVGLSKSQSGTLKAFQERIFKLKKKTDDCGPLEILEDIIEYTGLKDYYHNQETSESIDRWMNIEELLSSVADFQEMNPDKGLAEFLEEVSLLSDLDQWNEAGAKVTLMTVHSAKGLEYRTVVVAGLEESLFPITSGMGSDSDIEEERRLFYVAVTRAIDRLYLLYSNSRIRYGTGFIPMSPSRFINEIPVELKSSSQYTNTNEIDNILRDPVISKVSDFSADDRVEHKFFGKGTIVNVTGRGENAKITISFHSNVVKKFIAKYANLKKISS